MASLDLGCYGDGANGHQHTRERCAGLIEDYANALQLAPRAASETAALVASLRGEMPDDASDELDAEEWLNDRVAHADAWWGWQDGDFGLWPCDGED